MFMGESTEYWHNQGQTDYAEGDYDPPYLSSFGVFDEDFSEAAIEAAEHYDEGWKHAKSQDC